MLASSLSVEAFHIKTLANSRNKGLIAHWYGTVVSIGLIIMAEWLAQTDHIMNRHLTMLMASSDRLMAHMATFALNRPWMTDTSAYGRHCGQVSFDSPRECWSVQGFFFIEREALYLVRHHLGEHWCHVNVREIVGRDIAAIVQASWHSHTMTIMPWYLDVISYSCKSFSTGSPL